MSIDNLIRSKLNINKHELEVLKIISQAIDVLDIKELAKQINKNRTSALRHIAVLLKTGVINQDKVIVVGGFKYVYYINNNKLKELKNNIIVELKNNTKFTIKEIREW